MFDKRFIFILFIFFATIGMISSVNADESSAILNATDDVDDIVVIGVSDNSYNKLKDFEESDDILESSSIGTFKELQNKIKNAKKGSTVYLTKNYRYNDEGADNGIKITKSLTIDGKGHSIDGDEYSGLFLINKVNNVVLKNIVFKNGYLDDVGNIAVFNSNNIKFVNCVFKNNDANDGSAVFLSNVNHVSFEGCNFISNYADDLEGEGMGTVYLENCQDSSFTSCYFKDNYAIYGSAVYLKDCDCSFNNCRFVDNNAENCGGAIYSIQSYLNCLNTNFYNNWGCLGGGDIYSRYGMVFLKKCIFNESYSKNGFGGSLSFDNDYVQITECSFERCWAPYSSGGAIHCLDSILTSVSSQFKSCYSNFYGGAICSLNTDLIIQSNTFYNDSTDYGGGSIFTIFGSIGIDSSTFLYSSASRAGAIYIRSPYKINNITNNRFLYCCGGSSVHIEEYFDEIPESGNIYEDVYFVVGKFDDNLDSETSSNYSNVLTYVISNSNIHQDLTFYKGLTNKFIKDLKFTEDASFNIHDEFHPLDSILFLNMNSSIPSIIYDVGHCYGEFSSMPLLEFNIYDLDGDSISHLQAIQVPTTRYNHKLNSSLLHVAYFSKLGNSTSMSLYPVSYDGKNLTFFDKYPQGTQIWTFSASPEEFYNYRINGKFFANLNGQDLFFEKGYFYQSRKNIIPTPLFQQDGSSNGVIFDVRSSWEAEYLSYDDDYYFAGDFGFTTPVKDQGIGSNCWAFAGISTLETCLKKLTGIGYDFSENNAKNLMASSSVFGLSNDVNAGGFDSMFIGYLTSWLGPVFDSDDEYNPLSYLSVELNSFVHIMDISFLSPRKNSLDNYEFKKAIMDCGAVAVIFDWTTPRESHGLHAVSLVGWDDNYYGADSLGNFARGAWIFKNSWSDEWGEYEDGYGYLSYDQKLSGEIEPYMHAYTFIFNESDIGYQEIYQYDFVGLTDYICANNEIYYKNKFTAKYDEYLYAFSTYFEKPTYFTFSVSLNGKIINVTEDNLPIINSIHYSPAGYHTIPLGYNLTINEGDEFEIIIKLVNDKNYVPVCQADELYRICYPSNVSFISYNGVDWVDLYDLNSNNTFAYGGIKSNTCQVACIKAFSNTWRDGAIGESFTSETGSIHSSVYDIYNISYSISNDFNINIDIPNWESGSESYENFIELKMNYYPIFDEYFSDNPLSRTYYLKIVDGRGHLDIDEKIWRGYYSCSAKLKSSCFRSNTINFDFVVDKNKPGSTFSQLKEIIDNAPEESVITLDKNYYLDINFNESYILINKSLTIDGKGYTLNGLLKTGIFKINPNCTVNFKNINFKLGHADYGGAIYNLGNLNISNCDFVRNTAFYGAAIYNGANCSISYSKFESNSADYGGAIFVFNSTCNINKTTFRLNSAYSGGAIGAEELSNLNIVSSDFADNYATYGVSILSSNILNVTNSNFKSNLIPETIYFYYYHDKNNHSYGNLFLKNNNMGVKKGAHIFYNESEIPYNSSMTLIFNIGSTIRGEYADLCRIVDEDGSTFAFPDVNVTIRNENTHLTLKIKYNRDSGCYMFDTSSLDYGTYYLDGNLSKLYARNCVVKSGVLYVVKKSILYLSDLTKVYGKSNMLKITLKDSYGKAISNVYIEVKLNGKSIKIKTNSKGKASIPVNLPPKKYIAIVSFSGNHKYSSVSKSVKITVKKAKPKIIAKNKKFKVKTKVKKYTIKLIKNNVGKVMKKTKVTLKIRGKTISAKTNFKGKATFKITNLKKKGNFKAIIRYGGDKYYNKVIKKVKIKVK